MLAKYDFGLYGRLPILYSMCGGTPLKDALAKRFSPAGGQCFALLPEGLEQDDLSTLISYRFVHSILTARPDLSESGVYEEAIGALAEIIRNCAARHAGGATLVVEDLTETRESVRERTTELETVVCKYPDSKFMTLPGYQDRFFHDNVYRMLQVNDTAVEDVESFLNLTEFADANLSILTSWDVPGNENVPIF